MKYFFVQILKMGILKYVCRNLVAGFTIWNFQKL